MSQYVVVWVRRLSGQIIGDEATFIPGGRYPDRWIAKSDGTFAEGVKIPCPYPYKTSDAVTINEIGELGHCAADLLSDEHMYIELFANARKIECVACVDCKCYSHFMQ